MKVTPIEIYDGTVTKMSVGKIRVTLAHPMRPGDTKMIMNNNRESISIDAGGSSLGSVNRFVLPTGMNEIVLQPNSVALFVAKRPSKLRRFIAWMLRRRAPLDWVYSPGATDGKDSGA